MATLVMVAVALRRGGGAAAVTALAVDGWLGGTAVLAAGGLFSDFSRVPPRIMIALVPPLLVILWLCRSAAVGRLLDEIPPAGWSTLRPSASSWSSFSGSSSWWAPFPPS